MPPAGPCPVGAGACPPRAASPTPPTTASAQASLPHRMTLEDESLVIVEDVADCDEDEDDDNDAAPTLAAQTPSPSPAPQVLGSMASLLADAGVVKGASWMRAVSTGRSSSLSPLASAFFPAMQFAGRSKALRWMEDCSDPDLDCTSSTAQSPYLEATRRAVKRE
ncbi:uncharacterized protein [Miscanthus floridulus]|uniref:uncharacterized protein n=1 Tax=Miscanthus floridulus TaxID=154761 RepID=UPI00345941BC